MARLIALFGLLIAPFVQANDPAITGQWSPVTNWPIQAIHLHVLPTGKVMFWTFGDNSWLWDPVADTFTNAPLAGYKIFCSGHSFLADGRLHVTGGDIANGVGVAKASIYDPVTNLWTPLPDMNNARWYPTNVTLTNGDVLVVSGNIDNTVGVNPVPQVWQVASNSWRNLTNATLGIPLYPMMHLAPNGRVFLSGPNQLTRYLNPAAGGQWVNLTNRVFGARGYGSAVMYDDGKIIVMGGGDPPLASAEVIDLNAPAPGWRAVASMNFARRQLNATLLADGQVLVTGGSGAAGFDNSNGVVTAAEIWNPVTEAWTLLSSNTVYRGYHSTAALLPDGRVVSAGGDLKTNAEMFSPPYLFQGARPVVTHTPTEIAYGQTFFITSPDAVDRVHWVRLTSVTHAFNQNQRINRLVFTPAVGGLVATAPSQPALCPPGHYLQFLIGTNGVPSIANIVRIGPATGVIPTSFAVWKATQFSLEEQLDGLISGPTADIDGDGLSNLMEYALKRNPHIADAGDIPQLEPVDGYLTLTYTKVLAATDLNYIIEATNDVSGVWSVDGIVHTPLANDGVLETIRARDAVPMSDAAQRFMRLRVEQP